jgi:hypothetical protein
MIHFITVHFKTELWIDLQLRYLRRFVSQPFAVHAAFTGIDIEPHRAKFETALGSTEDSHPAKLNKVADLVGADASSSDILVFIDSDAFPITDITRLVDELDRHPLIAIRRDENLGDPHPHPSFCMTTVGFWREIGGDWGHDHPWTNGVGQLVQDTGGNLLRIITDRGVDWKPLLRSNRVNLHPLLFGIYDDAVYHHVAGSRPIWTRHDINVVRQANPSSSDDEINHILVHEVGPRNAELGRAVISDLVADRDFLASLR